MPRAPERGVPKLTILPDSPCLSVTLACHSSEAAEAPSMNGTPLVLHCSSDYAGCVHINLNESRAALIF